MAPKKLPSFCGLPISWHPDMEVRLGYWEARDETRDFKDVLKILKRDFPDLSDVSIYDILDSWHSELTAICMCTVCHYR